MKTISQIILLTILSVSFLYPQKEMFRSLTVENGLSSSEINCLLQDKLGFIWIGTDNGLNRFDGTEFKIFRNKPKDQSSISDNSIWALCEDLNGNLWIGTKGGNLNKYSSLTEKFEQIKLNEKEIENNSITALLEDKDGNIWIGTYSEGLYKYEPASGKIINWEYDPGKKNMLSNNYVSSLLQDADGFIWVSTYNGLNRINPAKLDDGFKVFFADISNGNSIPDNLVWHVNQSTEDKNLLWIGTANGLCSYDIKKQKFIRHSIKAKYPSQFSNSFASIVEQNVKGINIIWTATYAGLFQVDLTDNSLEQFISDKKNSNGLLSNQVDELLIDNSGVLWIATKKGVNYLSLKPQKFNSIFLKESSSPIYQELLNSDIKFIINGSDSDNYIAAAEGLYRLKIENQKIELKKFDQFNDLNLWSIEKGLDNDLWIGTYGNGLIHFDLKTEKLQFIKIKSPTFPTSAFNYIKSLHTRKDGNLWIGFWGGGLALYNTKTNNYKIWIREEAKSKSISHNDVWALQEDNLGRLWIGTNGGGLNLYIPNNNGEFLNWKYEPDDSNSLINNSILSINEIKTDDKSTTVLLLGTENGLSKLTIKNDPTDKYKFKLNFDNVESLSERSISGMLLDEKGDYWISSNTGLMRFNQVTLSITNFGNSDGLNSSIFNPDAFCKTKNGMMIFGSSKGPVIFNPEQISFSDYQPKILFTDFQIFNKSVIPDKDSPLKESITSAKEMDLAYNQNTFTFKFSSTDFNPSEQVQFKYKLEGFDKDWIISAANRTANYTNINPGKYRFIVKGTNSDGSWSDQEASINIVITPPYWKTIWAYMFYILLILLGLYVIRRFELSKTKLKNELKLKELEAEKIREIENIKSRFFTNLSHEFRTPLMLIKGPVEQLLTNKKINQTEQVELIKRNSEKLQNLIDQLLELSQLESSSIELKAKKENLVTIVRGIFFSFSSLAERKNIKLNFQTVSDKILTWIDRDKLEKILNNLLSNAFKFTPDNGIINIEIESTSIDNIDHAIVKIKDSGIGIEKDKVDKIFDRFYQVDDSSKRPYSGSGIGLSLVKELVDLHRWKISVNSKIGSGTEFTLQIPLDDNYLDDLQKVHYQKTRTGDETISSNSEPLIENEETDIEEIKTINKSPSKTTGVQKKSTLLIVEDSEDVRIYLTDILKEDYNLILAENGEEGLKEALDKLPDLIISDVMMPVMDGIEFCKKLKSDWQTAHIPVILLTAKASTESKIEGLETGADDYVTKPFSYRELSVRIKNLLQQRKQLRQKYSKDVVFKPENITPNKADQEFLQKAISIVEKNISNYDFDSDEFAKQMFLSRSQLHRKIQAISGQSTGEFIRTLRLKKAAGLIMEKKLSITQIALEIGFNSPSHFTKAFKQMFDCLPSEFLNRHNS